MSTIIIALLVAFVGLCFLWIRSRFNYWSNRGFAQAKASLPFGSLDIKVTSAESYDKIYKEFKGKAPAVGFYNFLAPTILPIDTELIKHIFVKDFQSFHDRGFYHNKKDDPLSEK